MAGQINLYDPALGRQRDWLALGNVVGAGLLLVVVLGVVGYGVRLGSAPLASQAASAQVRLTELRAEVAALETQAAARKPDPQLAEVLKARRVLLEMRGEVVATLRRGIGTAGHVAHVDYLRGLARQSFDGLWLTGFSLAGPEGSIEIRGRTVDPALLPEYIRRLNGEAAFQGRAFAALKIDSPPPAPAGAAAAPRYHDFVLAPVTAEHVRIGATAGAAGRPG